MTTEQWERENQDTLMEYFIDGDPSVRRIQCEYCRKVIYTQTRNRKYCSFQTCGHRMLNLRKSLKKRIERIEQRLMLLTQNMEKSRFREYIEYAADTKRMLRNSFLIRIARGIGSAIGFTLLGALLIYILRGIAESSLPIIGDFIAELMDIVDSKR